MLEEQHVIPFHQHPLLCPLFWNIVLSELLETICIDSYRKFSIQLFLNSLDGRDHQGLPGKIERNHEVIPLPEINYVQDTFTARSIHRQ